MNTILLLLLSNVFMTFAWNDPAAFVCLGGAAYFAFAFKAPSVAA